MRSSRTLILFAMGLMLASTGVQAAAKCDRDCLKATLDRYLDAVVKHDPHSAGLDAKFHYTENAIAMKAGEGLWKSARGLGKVQRRYLDPVSGQAAYFGFIEAEEGDGGVGIATLRIRVVNKKVVEGETIVGRKSDGTFNADGLLAQPPPEKPAASAKASREVLQKAAESYFEGLGHADGSMVLRHKGCYRIENGLLLTGRPIRDAKPDANGEIPKSDCATLEIFKSTINGVSHRRYPVIDEEAGMVLGMGILERPVGAKRPDGSIYPRNLLSEYFLMEDGQIRGIYAAMHYMTPDVADAPGWK